jgi:hypothetical protein
MFIVGILSWWYGAGWQQRFAMLRERLATTNDYFSIDLLATTLFAPFRQISAGQVNGPLGVKFRAFLDRLISRCIGAMVRSAMIIIGVAAILVHSVIGCITLIMWALVPLLPFVGLWLYAVGWLPWII